MQSVSTINQSEKAKTRLATIAESSRLSHEVVYYLFSFHWNMDGSEGTWVQKGNLLLDAEYHHRYLVLFETLNIHSHVLSPTEITAALFTKLHQTDKADLLQRFISGAAQKDYCRVSQFASCWYLRNATPEKLETLNGPDKDYGPEALIQKIFLKLFRGGAIERYNLGYLYADLVCEMPCQPASENRANWLNDFLNELVKAPAKPSLSALRNMLKQHLKGDKHFLQTVLEALSYAGYLKVDGHEVELGFIPDYRNELSPHFNSNEWTYPLRFWQ